MRYFASLSLLFLGIGLLVVQMPLLDRWEPQVGAYAAQTSTYAGPCARAYAMPEGSARDSAIDTHCGAMGEPWQLLPWGLGIGLVIATCAIACPWTYWIDRT